MISAMMVPTAEAPSRIKNQPIKPKPPTRVTKKEATPESTAATMKPITKSYQRAVSNVFCRSETHSLHI